MNNIEDSNKEQNSIDVKDATIGFITIVIIGCLFLGGICLLDWYLDKKHGTNRYSKENKVERNWENPWDDSRWQENQVPWLEHTQR